MNWNHVTTRNDACTTDRITRCEIFIEALLNISNKLQDAYNFPFGGNDYPAGDWRSGFNNKDFERNFYSDIYNKIDSALSALQEHLVALHNREALEDRIYDFDIMEGIEEFDGYPWEEAVNE